MTQEEMRESETERLLRWKGEACVVISAWEKVGEAIGGERPLGESRAASALREVQRLRAVNDSIKETLMLAASNTTRPCEVTNGPKISFKAKWHCFVTGGAEPMAVLEKEDGSVAMYPLRTHRIVFTDVSEA